MADHFYGWENAQANHDRVWTGSECKTYTDCYLILICHVVMGSTPDALPHAGKVPGSKNQWILAGFNGIGMFQIFTMAQAVAEMVIRGLEYEDTGLSGLFKATDARLAVRRQIA